MNKLVWTAHSATGLVGRVGVFNKLTDAVRFKSKLKCIRGAAGAVLGKDLTTGTFYIDNISKTAFDEVINDVS